MGYSALYYDISYTAFVFECMALPLIQKNCYISFESDCKFTCSFHIFVFGQQLVDSLDFLNIAVFRRHSV